MRAPLVLVATCLACGSTPSASVVRVTGPATDTSLLAGRRWIDVRQPAREVTSSRSTAPADAGALIAFIDSNGDGRLDPVAEDSTPCLWDGSEWACEVEPRQVTVLRMQSAAGARTFVLPRLPEASERFCLGGTARCEGTWARRPREATDTSLSTCEPDVTLWTDSQAGEALHLGQRPTLGVIATRTVLSDGSVDLRIDSDAALDRLHVWVGGEGEEAPTWDSETSTERWRDADGGSTITVPAVARHACPGCAITVAAADHRRWRDERSGMVVLDVRERHLQIGLEP